ncbi:MAG: phosphoribosyltransferase family protein [Planctomycetia bacterium]
MISWAQRWRREAVRWAGNGVDLLFPPRCRWCRAEETPAPVGLCAGCVREFVDGRDRCPRCGVAGPAPADAGCPACRRGRPAWDGIVVLGGYGDELREAILRVKRPGAEDLARALATLLVDRHRVPLEQASVDAVVPVPMHWWRRACRGTSAAEEIAHAVARELDVEVVSALVRCRATRMQNELPADDRGANVAGAFRVRTAVAGRRVLVVDDVVTTGSTLAACCAALRAAGAAGVHGAALAKADRWGDESERGAHV